MRHTFSIWEPYIFKIKENLCMLNAFSHFPLKGHGNEIDFWYESVRHRTLTHAAATAFSDFRF
jgi:hypothetical protein